MKRSILISLFLIFSFSVYAKKITLNQSIMSSPRVNNFKVINYNSITLPDLKFDKIVKEEKDCRANISKVICLVDPQKDGYEVQHRPCLEGSKEYAHYFEKLYDNYPPLLQRMFCSLKVIYIEKEFFGTAYAGTIKDDNDNTIGAHIGIRQSVLDEKIDLTLWSSWKEQLSFGGISNSYTLTDGLPTIQTTSNESVNDFLYFVVAHEFAHLFDFTNNINKTESCDEVTEEDPYPECIMHKNGWGGLSWLTDRKAKPKDEFENRRELCFYWCNDSPLSTVIIPKLYSELHQTSFISIYSTVQPWDDFAESLAYFVMAENLDTKYSINIANDHSYNIIDKLKSNVFRSKYDYLDKLLKSTDIIYP